MLEERTPTQADTTNTNGSSPPHVANHSQGEQQNKATGGLKTRERKLVGVKGKSKDLKEASKVFNKNSASLTQKTKKEADSWDLFNWFQIKKSRK